MTYIDEINELIGSRNFEDANKLIQKTLKEYPDDVELLRLAGLTAINLCNWVEARRYFETSVKLNSDDATSWFYLANCYENLNDLIPAKNAYTRTIELRHEYIEAYTKLVFVLVRLNEFDLTIEYAQKALETDKDNFLFEFVIGVTLMKQKNYKDAIAPLIKSHEKNPNDINTINSLGTCYTATGQMNEAITVYEKAISINPDVSMTYYNIGSVYQIQNNHKKACEYFEKAIAIDEDESYIVSLALSEVKLEQYEKALEHYKQLSVMCPNKENYLYNAVTCYEALGDIQTAIGILEKLLYVNPKFLLPAQKLAKLYIQTNQLNKAKDIYDRILLKNKVTAEMLHQYAILSSSLCDTATAERILKKVIKMNPDIAKAHKDLGIIYLNKRLFDYAEEEFKTALGLAPDDFEILFEYGNFLYSKSENKKAEEYYLKALKISPANVLALTFMALNKLILNSLDEAKEYIMKALKIEHNHEYVLFCAGRILYAKGEYEEAKRYLVKAVEQNPDIETQNTLALTYFALEDYNQALNIFKNIIEKQPQSISVLMDIARCYEKLNDNDNALSYLDKVVDIFPDNEEAHEMIRKLS